MNAIHTSTILLVAAMLPGACHCMDSTTGQGPSTMTTASTAPPAPGQVAKLQPVSGFMRDPLTGPLSAGPGFRGAMLPIPLRHPAGPRLAILQLADAGGRPLSAQELARVRNEVSVPSMLVYLDPATGEAVDASLAFNPPEQRYGIPDPPDWVVGRMDDPAWLPKARVELLRQAIYAALDVLLPFFADENKPWTEDATKAAQEVRDFFPVAAEPGLWSYYKAEGREFFAWVERNAPPAKARLPWE